MRYFVLIDLRTQAEFLPPEMQQWSQERFLSWLRLFGEVLPWPLPRFTDAGHTPGVMAWLFCTPTKLETRFVVSKRGQLVIMTPNVHQIWGEEFESIYDLET